MTADLNDISRRLKKYSMLPVASPVVRDTLQTLASETVSFAEVAREIERDPDLALQILRTANSLTSSFTGRIHSVLQAVRLLGFKTVKGILLSAVLMDRSKGHPGISELWSHSQMVSLIAKIIARRQGFPWEEEAQTAGLLHDIGKVFFMKSSRNIIRKCSRSEIRNSRNRTGEVNGRHSVWIMPLSGTVFSRRMACPAFSPIPFCFCTILRRICFFPN